MDGYGPTFNHYWAVRSDVAEHLQLTSAEAGDGLGYPTRCLP